MNPKKSKKKVWITLAIFLFVIPLFITLFIVHQNMDPDLKKGSVTAITLIHDEEKDEVKERKEIQFFVSLATGGSVIEKTADPLYEYRKLEVIYRKLGGEFTYRFYLSDSIHNCVYTDPDGTIYLLEEKAAQKLLAHPLVGGYALSFAARPTLTFYQGGSTYSAKMVEGDWIYKKANESSSSSKVKESTDCRVILPQGEKFNFRFSLNPDFCKVLLQNEKGDVLFAGKPEEMPLIERESDEMLTMSITCDWYEDSHEEYHGSLTYTYDVFYDIPTAITSDRTEVYPGENITLTISNSSASSLAVTPNFAAGKIQKVAIEHGWSVLIPVAENATPREYSILVMGEDVEESITITVLPKSE